MIRNIALEPPQAGLEDLPLQLQLGVLPPQPPQLLPLRSAEQVVALSAVGLVAAHPTAHRLPVQTQLPAICGTVLPLVCTTSTMSRRNSGGYLLGPGIPDHHPALLVLPRLSGARRNRVNSGRLGCPDPPARGTTAHNTSPPVIGSCANGQPLWIGKLQQGV
jgi:hypothetical protein